MTRLIGAALMAVVVIVPLRAAGDTRLVDAARRRDVKGVASLLRQRVDANAPQPDGATALHWAAHWDDLEMAGLLLDAHADVNAANEYGVMPLWLAATNGSAAMIERLLDAGARPNAALPTGETVLMTAVRTGKPAAVAALISRGADVNGKQTSKGQTALMWAASEQHLDVVRTLLDHGADIHARTLAGFTALMFAAREPSLDVVTALVERGADVNASSPDGSTPLLVATVRGHSEIAMYLLDRGAKPDGDVTQAGYAPLHWAAGRFEGVITFDYPDAPGEWAALAGIPSQAAKIELIKALLAHGATVDARLTKQPPRYGFHLAKQGQLPGGTPFYLAAQVADLDVMRLLLAAGADPEVRAGNGTTALMMAAGIGRSDNETRVPESDQLAATKLMLQLGSDVHAANEDGFTALHGAAQAGLNTVVQTLLDNGSAINARNKRDETPLDITEGYHAGFYFERPGTADLLRRLGARGGVTRVGLPGQTDKTPEGARPTRPKTGTPEGGTNR